MKAINRKLLRDLGKLRGQVITICLVVASGIGVYISMQTAYVSLHTNKDTYYEQYRFPDVFARARRVPLSVAEQIRAIDGVALLHTRIIESLRVPLEQQVQAASGQLVSLPDHGTPPLNDVHLREGRIPEPGHGDEALLLESFANKYGISPGDTLSVVLNGTLREVLITGLAMSPEYVFAFGGDAISYEAGSYAVLWMRQAAVAAGFELEGAFNDVVIRLETEASEAEVIRQLDQILAPYGGFGAYGRARHPSNYFVESELDQLEVTALIIPFIFLAVAAFLVNVVLNRLVQLQRGQIASLKALGYSNLTVGLHFLKLVSTIVAIGAVIGIGIGSWLGDGLTALYDQYFRFPYFDHDNDPSVIVVAVAVSSITAVVGAILSVRQIVKMPPAEAMQPPAPLAYRASAIDRVTRHVVGPLGRMVFRELRRRPVRLSISIIGISTAVMILVIGRFAVDSMDRLMDLQFEIATKEDLVVSLKMPLPERVKGVMRQLPGVYQTEGLRTVPIRLQAGSRFRDTMIQGIQGDSKLRTLINRDGAAVDLPLSGLVLTDVLAEILGVRPGQYVDISLLEGDRRHARLLVAGTVRDMLGLQVYMRGEALTAFLGESPVVSSLLLAVDREHIEEAQRRLYEMPAVMAVSRPSAAREAFDKQQGGMMNTMTMVLVFFASVIAVGIVYNNARVSLSMRSRDLASMRVLGFSRREISSILLGELAVQVLLALPIGMWMGAEAAEALLAIDPENFRMPAVISSKTYAFAGLVTMVAALASGLLVRRKLDRLDLIGVLKTRE